MIQLSLSPANAPAIAPILTVSAAGTGEFVRALALAGAVAEEAAGTAVPGPPAISLPPTRQAIAAPGKAVRADFTPEDALLDVALSDEAAVPLPLISERIEPSPLPPTDDGPLAPPAVAPDRVDVSRQAAILVAPPGAAAIQSSGGDQGANAPTQSPDRHPGIALAARSPSARRAVFAPPREVSLPDVRGKGGHAGPGRKVPIGDMPVVEPQPVVANGAIAPLAAAVIPEKAVTQAFAKRAPIGPSIASPIALAAAPTRAEPRVEANVAASAAVGASVPAPPTPLPLPLPAIAPSPVPVTGAAPTTVLLPVQDVANVAARADRLAEPTAQLAAISPTATTVTPAKRHNPPLLAPASAPLSAPHLPAASPIVPNIVTAPVPLVSLPEPVQVPVPEGRLAQSPRAEPIAFNRVDAGTAKSAAPTQALPASIVAVSPSPPEAPLIGVAVPALRAFAAAIAATTARPERVSIDEPVVATHPTGAIAPEPPAPRADSTVTLPAPIDMRRQDWTRALIDRIDAVHDVANARDTRITLVPDALGKIEVALRQVGETIHVQFAADVAATRTMLAEAQPRLAELADARGLRLGDTIIAAASDQSTASTSPGTAPTATSAAGSSASSGSATSFGQSADQRRAAPQPSANSANSKNSTNSAQSRADSDDRIA